jgi:hypothetical protein
MSSLVILGIIAWSLVPYKAWSRGITGDEGFNAGDLVVVVVLAAVLLQRGQWKDRTTLWPWIVALWCVLLVSATKGILAGESVREIGRVARGQSFWVIVPLMVLTITDRVRLGAFLSGMTALVLVAAASLVAFSFFPSMIPAGDEVGVFRGESVGGFERVFTLGMWAVFGGSILALGAVFLRPSTRVLSLLLLLVLLGALSLTFARTFFVGIAVATIVFVLLSRRVTAGLAVTGVTAGALFAIVAELPGTALKLLRAVSERAMLFFTEAPEYAFQTFFWRVAEFTYLSDRMTTATDQVFGVLGRTYALPEGYTASMPHISYLGIFFGHGYAGVAAYAVILTAMTARMVRNALRMRASDLAWLGAGALAAWVALLAAGLSAPVLQYAWGVAALAFAAGLSETAACLQNTSHESSLDQYRHTVPERGSLHPRHG